MASNLATTTKTPTVAGAALNHLPLVGTSPIASAGAEVGGIFAMATADRVAERAGKVAPSKMLAPAGLALGLLGGSRYRDSARAMIVASAARYAVEAGAKAGDAIADAAGYPALPGDAPRAGEAE